MLWIRDISPFIHCTLCAGFIVSVIINYLSMWQLSVRCN